MMKLFILLLLLELVLGNTFVTTSNCTDTIEWRVDGVNVTISPLSGKMHFRYGAAAITYDMNTIATKCSVTDFSDHFLKIASSTVQYLASHCDLLGVNFAFSGFLNHSTVTCKSFGPNVIQHVVRKNDDVVSVWIQSVHPVLSCQSIKFNEGDTLMFEPAGWKIVPTKHTLSSSSNYNLSTKIGITIVLSLMIILMVLAYIYAVRKNYKDTGNNTL